MKTLIFLKPFTLKNPTRDEQNDFMMREIFSEVECRDLGDFYTNEILHDKNLAEFIPAEVKRLRPEWVVAEGKCATAALSMRHQKKILINPKVTYEDLNNVSEQSRRNTYGFFDEHHEQDYERFQSAYLHAAWFTHDDDLTLFTIKEVVQSIIETGEW